MKQTRLSLALHGAQPLPSEGRIVVFRPGTASDLADLPADRLEVVQGFRPTFDALAAQGFAVVPEATGSFAAAIIFLPRVRSEARALVAEAAARVAPGGPIWIDGQKTDGIDAMLRELRALVPVADVLAKAHGKAFVFPAPGPQVFAGWASARLTPVPGFVTVPGVFSATEVDRGSAILAAALPARLPTRIADLGAGWGWLSAQVLTRKEVQEVHLIEAEHLALACARQNVADPRARFHWADATRFKPERRFNAVVCNPPFHAGRAADPALGAAFIRAAAAMLTPDGALWLVANRHLPYERTLAACFRDVAEVGGDGAFKVICATRPITARTGAPVGASFAAG